MKHSTHLELSNGGRYPCIGVTWDGNADGYRGKLTLWHGPGDRDEKQHDVSIVQTCPLGSVHVYFDSCGNGAGCWAMGHIDGTGISERDLQWATLWAALALRSRRALGDMRPVKF